MNTRILNTTRAALSRARSCGFIGGHRPYLVDCGLDWIRSSIWTLIPADKDHAQVFVRRDALPSTKEQILSKHWYEEIDPLDVPDNLPARASFLISRIQRFHEALGDDNEHFVRSLRAPLNGKTKATLKLLCKTHKPAGEVSFRNVHAAGGYASAGLSRWLMGRLDPSLKLWPHILFQTSDLFPMLKNVVATDQDILIKLDVRDFFLSGSHEDVVSACTSHIGHSSDKHLTADVIWLVFSI